VAYITLDTLYTVFFLYNIIIIIIIIIIIDDKGLRQELTSPEQILYS